MPCSISEHLQKLISGRPGPHIALPAEDSKPAPTNHPFGGEANEPVIQPVHLRSIWETALFYPLILTRAYKAVHLAKRPSEFERPGDRLQVQVVSGVTDASVVLFHRKMVTSRHCIGSQAVFVRSVRTRRSGLGLFTAATVESQGACRGHPQLRWWPVHRESRSPRGSCHFRSAAWCICWRPPRTNSVERFRID